MAPARRKGSARAAAAAAAARQQWKVGDLVLAKMKGFPAWPAVISDPKKWGYSSDRKKLLVFFFGTKQIAFCNHVDIEAFTEERKKTLLAKRQGKGADFVRAVEEIVDCYDKLQKQIHDSGDEGSVLDSSISGHKISMGLEDNIPPLRACQSHDCDVQNNDDFNPDKNSISPSMNDDYCNLDSDMKHLAEKVPIIDQLRQTPFATTTSLAKKSRNTLSQNFVIQKRSPSLSRSRSSTRVDASKFHTAEMTVSKDDSMGIPVESMGNNIEAADTAARNGLPNNAVDSSICSDIEKHISTVTLVSDGAHEDVGSGITTVESKSNLSRDDAFESKDEHYMISSMDANNKVNCQADYQSTTLALQNNRKQDKGEITENMSTYGATDEISQFDIDKNTSSTFNKINERIPVADGDEHLPLVKRARARKGDASLEESQSDAAQKKPEKLSIEHYGKDSIDLPKNKHTVISANVVNISPSINCTKSKGSDMLLNDQSFHLRGITVDAEAALPPSKRLHRALEAMSANAAKARDDAIEALDIPEISNECLDLSEAVTHDTTNSTLSKPEKLHQQKTSETVILNLSPRSSSFPVTETEEPIREMITDAKASSFNRNSQHEESTKISTIDRSLICSVSAETIKGEDLIQTPQPCLTESSDKTAFSTSEKSLSTVDGESEMMQQKKCCFKDTVNQFASQHGDKMEGEDRSFFPDIPKMNVEKHSTLFLNDMPPTIPLSGCSMSNVASGSIKPSISLSKEKYEEKDMKQYTAEIKHSHTPKDLVFSPDSTPMKVLIATAQVKQHYSRTSSLSDCVIDAKLASDAMSRLSPFHPEDSSEHLSGHSERTNCQLSCSRSPDANSHQKNSTQKSDVNGSRLKSLSLHEQKGSNTFSGTVEASAALRSFEALVCTLTRAKESISRATHYAVECAKHDVAGEVVDILLRNLEKEPSLHRRVDMFFLVDSITRFCRGQKGVAGDIYPSIFQPVLGRMLSAAAPLGNAAVENRRQCLKVLRLWLERKTLPEPIVHHHIRAIESLNECSLNNGFSRRPSRTERAVDDPVREMEGMLVDEYGSNACFQLPGLLNSHVFEETGGSDSDDKSFEAVTPEHPLKISGDKESIMNPITEKHKHILEDVDGELEMEDVAPPSATEINSSRPTIEVGAQHHSQHQFEPHHMFFAPPLPEDRPPTTPPLPSSPPPFIPPYPSPSAQLLPTASKKPADFTSHSYIGTNSMQNHIARANTRPIEQNTKSVSSDAVPYYAPGYRDLSNHMLPPSSSVGSSCAYMSNNASSRLSINQGIANLPSVGESSSNKAYHLQPPAPTVSNQFSYVQSEQRQSWGKCSSQSDKLFQLGHDQQVGNLYGDGRGMVSNESCGFSSTVPSGHIHSEKIEMSSSSLPFYGAPPETSPMTNQCWPHPPRPPSYQYPAPPSRPLENHLPRMNGAPAYWRRR